jgi:hypothetical protein
MTLAIHGPVFAAEVPAAPEARAEGFVEVLRGAKAKGRAREWTEAAALWARVVEMNPCEGDYWAQLASARRSAGDDRRVVPYTRMRGSVSDLYWQSSWPLDYRTWIAPLLYAPPSFALYRANRDPAMEAILAYRDGPGSTTVARSQATQR